MNTENLQLFASRLRSERKTHGLSQAALADLMVVSSPTVQNWERGVNQPNAVYLTAMAAAAFDVNYLLTGLRAAPELVEAFARAARTTLAATAEDPAARQRLAELNIEAMRMALVPPISADEISLVRTYRALDPEARQAIDATLAAVAPKQPRKR